MRNILKNKKILIVDESESIRNDLTQILLEMGCLVEAKPGYLEALQAVNKSKFDTVLFHLNLPGLNPFSFVDAVHELSQKLPIIAMTGHCAPEIARFGPEIGCFEIIARTPNHDTLNNVLSNLFCDTSEAKDIHRPKVKDLPRILVVDDDKLVSYTIQRILKSLAASITVSFNPIEALEQLKTNSYDIMIVDLKMEEMSGVIVIEKMKKIQPGILPIMLTGHPDLESSISAFKAGVYDYLVKPIEPLLLQTVVSRAWDKLQLSRQRNYLFSELQKTLLRLNEEKNYAEESNNTKNRFLYHISHELKTPLNAILGFGQLLASNVTETDEQKSDYLQHILDGGNYLLRIVNDILDFSNIEAGKINPNIESISLDEIVVDCLNVVKIMAQNDKISLVNQITEGVIIKADSFRLKQILINLLTNGIKYNNYEGSVIVNLDSKVAEGLLRINITDTGKGIPESQIKAIFDPFVRVKETEQSVQGTGIGLAIARKLAVAMNGNIGVESKLGQGSTFWIDIPT